MPRTKRREDPSIAAHILRRGHYDFSVAVWREDARWGLLQGAPAPLASPQRIVVTPGGFRVVWLSGQRRGGRRVGARSEGHALERYFGWTCRRRTATRAPSHFCPKITTMHTKEGNRLPGQHSRKDGETEGIATAKDT